MRKAKTIRAEMKALWEPWMGSVPDEALPEGYAEKKAQALAKIDACRGELEALISQTAPYIRALREAIGTTLTDAEVVAIRNKGYALEEDLRHDYFVNECNRLNLEPYKP